MADMNERRDVGAPMGDWRAPGVPERAVLTGRTVTVEPLSADHAADLFQAYSADDRIWDYLGYGPFASLDDYRAFVANMAQQTDPLYYAIRPKASGRVEGIASFLRITPGMGVIEIGHINLAPAMQGTTAATEALFLMADHAFRSGYRRYEWKCDSLNRPSRRAAERLGFSFEGIFRQHMIYKGRNRDTAWFAILDKDWPGIRAAYEAWLAPANFDAAGRQKQSLGALTAPFVAVKNPET